jgi:hypothetical protein
MFYVHMTLRAGATVELPAEHRERAPTWSPAASRPTARAHECRPHAVSRPARRVALRALEPAMRDDAGRRAARRALSSTGNFVSSRRERIEQAKADWRAGPHEAADLDDGEFIRAAGRRVAAANPMS